MFFCMMYKTGMMIAARKMPRSTYATISIVLSPAGYLANSLFFFLTGTFATPIRSILLS